MIILSVQAQNKTKIKRQIGDSQKQLSSYTVEERYYLMIKTVATFICILYFRVN